MFRKYTFTGGIHPPHHKESTAHRAIETLPAPAKVILPVSQHIGAPAKLLVNRGDDVLCGQMLAEAGGFVSAPVFSSISGTVTTIADLPHPLGAHVLSVEIENDGKDRTVDFHPLDKPWHDAAPGELVKIISRAGIVGMGGAAFPTHVKLSPPTEKRIDILILNGAECEPCLTADHRLMLEKTRQILEGALILKKILGAQKAYIGIETNKPDAIAAVSELVATEQFNSLSVAKLKTKYPQGGEKQLINAITRRQVPSGGLPMDVGCVVQNVGTAYAVWDAIVNGRPLFERVLTVAGPNIADPKNLLVRIGTPIRTVLKACGYSAGTTEKIILGGPMMGVTVSELDAPVIKSTSGILAVNERPPGVQAYDCISCSNCVKACPINLVPCILVKNIDNGNYEKAGQLGVLDCIECGSCTYVCPAKINLVHYLKLGKFHVQAIRRAAQSRK